MALTESRCVCIPYSAFNRFTSSAIETGLLRLVLFFRMSSTANVVRRVPVRLRFTIPMSYPSFTVFSSIQYITTLRRATRVNQPFRAHKYIVLHECTLQHCRRLCERTANCNQPEVIVRNDTLGNRKIAVL